jgi:ferritin-like metal-binding protein YciE
MQAFSLQMTFVTASFGALLSGYGLGEPTRRRQTTMAEQTKRDEKLVQYLNEAYGKEKELETALEAHIGMTDRAPYKKRLKEHQKETKAHARKLEQRIKKLGGSPQGTQAIVGKASAAVKGTLHMVRGHGQEEKLLKNAKTEYSEEAEEIATYTAIEAFAEAVGDRETAKLARQIRREEERMASYLERLIPQLARAASRSEVPSRERSTTKRRSSTRTRGSTNGRANGRARTTRSSGRAKAGAR